MYRGSGSRSPRVSGCACAGGSGSTTATARCSSTRISRNPPAPAPILVADAAVQGQAAPHQIVMGMAMVVRAGVDVVIVGRGGGAATDLSAFNHERVVRTIARCPVPVISAVGHEVDLSLADLAADARASTPTAAAELAVPDGAALGELLVKERRRLDREIRHRLD